MHNTNNTECYNFAFFVQNNIVRFSMIALDITHIFQIYYKKL